MGIGERHAPAALPQGDLVSTAQDAGWAAGPICAGEKNLTPHRDSIPGPSNPQRVAILTELSRPIFALYDINESN
jgi:hypothetical protein